MDDKSAELKRQEKLSAIADTRPRDKQGHFIKTEKSEFPNTESENATVPLNFVKERISLKKTSKDDTLVDVRVNNPLKKITELLEDIKNQKAFSFNIKGSLGLAGVVIAVTTFGIFGGTQAFCNKGEQSHIGQFATLAIVNNPDTNSVLDRAGRVFDAFMGIENTKERNLPRLILIKPDQTIYHVIGLTSKQRNFPRGVTYIVTGEIDSCSQIITIKQPNAVQAY